MGTSSMYNGYSNNNSYRNPLLPAGFDEHDDQSDDDDENDSVNDNNQNDENSEVNQTSTQRNDKIVSWQSAKTIMSKVASGKSKKLGKAISHYVKAHKGAKSASKSAISAVRTTINIGQFINSVSSNGYVEALKGYNIEYDNKSVKDVLTELINYLAPSPVTKEDSIARKALIITMEQLYELLEKENFEINKINDKTLNLIIPIYVESYIYERLINDLGSRLETTSLNSKQAIKIEQELKDYINSKVDVVFKQKDFTKINLTKQEVESLYNQCYTIMENMI